MTTNVGRYLFSLATVAIGIQTWVCAHVVSHSLVPQYNVLPVLPWLPAAPWIAYFFGSVWIACGLGLVFPPTLQMAARILSALLFASTVILELPKYIPQIANISLRTIVLETLSLATFAWLVQGPRAMPEFITRLCRYLLAMSLVVFGVDHFLSLGFIAALLPAWIPWHVFWVAFFGVALISAGLSIGIGLLTRWSAASLGLMFAIWVVTLHLPRVFGLYAVPGATRNPAEWSSLFIAIAMCGGSWSLLQPDATAITSTAEQPTPFRPAPDRR